MDVRANAQALINVARFRLCFQASNETRSCMENLKENIHDELPEVADVMVPNCVYRGGCPEFTQCGFWKKFVDSVDNKDDLLDINKRYEHYNRQFYNR